LFIIGFKRLKTSESKVLEKGCHSKVNGHSPLQIDGKYVGRIYHWSFFSFK